MNKKIVIVSPAHPLRGGIAASTERLAVELQKKGLSVVIYSYSLQYPGFLFPGKTQFTSDPPPLGANGKPLHIVTCINSVNPLSWILTGLRIASERPDQVIVRFWLPFMGPALGTLLRIARWRTRTRVTGLVDNIIPHEKRPGDRLFARYFTGACDDFLVMSKSVGEEIRLFSGKPVVFSPHPLYDNYGELQNRDTARKTLGIPAEAQVALFFGFIRQYKGFDLFLRALAHTPHIHALVAGECYEDWASYQQIIDDNDMTERVHIVTDFIPSEPVSLYYSAADIVVQPYRSATQSGISQIAYHFGLPMIVSNVGGLPEIVTDKVSGYVVTPDAASVSDALNDFFENNRNEEMRIGVQREKERFTWDKMADALIRKPA
ncbi:MAG: glycosyltransferase [Saprospiraceae bacterium]|nr:glycosyltransferase [Saprospiraceae bacterium]